MDTIPTQYRVIILGFEGVASLVKWHSGFTKFLRRLRDCISYGGSGKDQEEGHQFNDQTFKKYMSDYVEGR